MSYLTAQQMRSRAAASQFSESQRAVGELGKFASLSKSASFDIFLSHSYQDAVLILGIKLTLEDYGFSVYVDWINDPKLDRTKVTPNTAQVLRERMSQCGNLLYVSTRSASASKWMPWELGYFDGHLPGHVAVLPIVGVGTGAWDGQEYIGLYPEVELVNFNVGGNDLGIFETTTSALHFKSFVKKGRTLTE